MRRILLISLSLVILLGIACKEEETIIDPVPEGDYTPESPEDCISNFELSFNKRNIELYKALLSPNYTFYFNPLDVGNDVDGYIIPDSWDYTEDTGATENMFTLAYDIAMQLPENDIGTPPEDATEYTASNIAISLLVMVDADNGFIANLGTVEFTFVKIDDGGEGYWIIKDWRDFTFAKKGTDSASLGSLKASFK
jgi:hypothetical protein